MIKLSIETLYMYVYKCLLRLQQMYFEIRYRVKREMIARRINQINV